MTAVTGEHPYQQDTAMVPWFEPARVAVDIPQGAVSVPAEPVPTFTPRPTSVPAPPVIRKPGATLPQTVRPARPLADVVVLRQVLDGVKRIPVDGEAVYASVVAERYGTGANQVIAPQPSAAALIADERARYQLAEIVYAAARHAEPAYGPYCEDCRTSDTGWCDHCERADKKAAALDRLHDLILCADTFAAAAVLVAQSVMPPMTMHAEGR